LLVLISFAAAGKPSNVFVNDIKPAASKYARTAGLEPLSSMIAFELCVWTRDYMPGRVTGYIVSNGTQCPFASEATHD